MRFPRVLILGAAIVVPTITAAQQPAAPAAKPITFQAVAALTAPAPTARESYGADSSQFGELRLPKGQAGAQRFPTIVLVHGGCWLSEYDYRYLNAMAQALADSGYAVWTIEFRRVGNSGGGWPNTFLDVGAATDHLRELAKRFPVDTNRVVAVGHSAGGQLALWLPTRRRLAAGSALYTKSPLRVRGVLSIDGIADMGAYARAKSVGCNSATPQLMGGMPDSVPDRYVQVDPMARVPLGARSRLLQGFLDQIVPMEQARTFAARAAAAGDDSQWTLLESAGHFDAVSPRTTVFYHVLDELRSLFDR